MKARQLSLFIFGVLLVAAILLLRVVLHTKPGLLVLAVIVVFQLLRFFYRSMRMLTMALWETSARIAEWIQENHGRRSTEKEAGHAARLL
jgi:hypothetical protein